jgi:hypothetical protein
MLLLLLLFRIYLRCGIFFQGLRWKSNWTAFLEHVGVLKGKRKRIDARVIWGFWTTKNMSLCLSGRSQNANEMGNRKSL